MSATTAETARVAAPGLAPAPDATPQCGQDRRHWAITTLAPNMPIDQPEDIVKLCRFAETVIAYVLTGDLPPDPVPRDRRFN